MGPSISNQRVAIITGGSSGIGQAVAVELARQDFAVVVVGQTPSRLDATLTLLNEASAQPKTCHLGLKLDVANETDMETMATTTVAQFGRIDLLIHSAGLGKKTNSGRVIPYPTAELPLDEWNLVVGINLTGAFLAARAVLETMIEQGAGHILNIGSSTTPHGLRGTPYAPAYCATKYALVGLTESLEQEVGQYGVRVQCVFPGAVSTPLTNNTMLARPFGGTISAESFAQTVVYIATQPMDTRLVHPHVIPFSALANKQ
jgi:3-oxoacyl-[acyl-carrier protein] reductase